VSKDGEPIVEGQEEAHLVCYRIEAENEAGRTLTADNQFERTTLTLDDDARLLCVPTDKRDVVIPVEEEED